MRSVSNICYIRVTGLGTSIPHLSPDIYANNGIDGVNLCFEQLAVIFPL